MRGAIWRSRNNAFLFLALPLSVNTIDTCNVSHILKYDVFANTLGRHLNLEVQIVGKVSGLSRWISIVFPRGGYGQFKMPINLKRILLQ